MKIGKHEVLVKSKFVSEDIDIMLMQHPGVDSIVIDQDLLSEEFHDELKVQCSNKHIALIIWSCSDNEADEDAISDVIKYHVRDKALVLTQGVVRGLIFGTYCEREGKETVLMVVDDEAQNAGYLVSELNDCVNWHEFFEEE